MKYSIYTRRGANDRRRPALKRAGYVKQVDFENWLVASGYEYVELEDNLRSGRFHIYDSNRDGSLVPSGDQKFPENSYLDTDGDLYLSDDERDEDADGLSNYSESHGPTSDSEWEPAYEDENRYTSSTSARISPTPTPTATSSATAPTTSTTTTSRT